MFSQSLSALVRRVCASGLVLLLLQEELQCWVPLVSGKAVGQLAVIQRLRNFLCTRHGHEAQVSHQWEEQPIHGRSKICGLTNDNSVVCHSSKEIVSIKVSLCWEWLKNLMRKVMETYLTLYCLLGSHLRHSPGENTKTERCQCILQHYKTSEQGETPVTIWKECFTSSTIWSSKLGLMPPITSNGQNVFSCFAKALAMPTLKSWPRTNNNVGKETMHLQLFDWNDSLSPGGLRANLD